MEPGILDIRIIRNRTFRLNVTPKAGGIPIDNTGYKAHMQIRDTSEAATPLLDLHSDSTSPVEIVLGGVSGTVAIRAGAEQTKLLTAPDNAVWDLVFISATDATERIPILEGEVQIDTDVTK